MFDALARLRLQLLLVSLLVIIGGSRFDALRPFEGEVVALVLPVVTVVAGVAPFRDARPGLRNVVYAVGTAIVVLVELACYPAVFDGVSAAPGRALQVALVGSALVAISLEVAGAQRGLRTRLTAWLSIALTFAWFFPNHASAQNLFGSVFAAFIVAFLVGGGGGLFAGEVAVRMARR